LAWRGGTGAKNQAYITKVRWHDPTFLKKLVWSVNNHFFAFSIVLSVYLKFSPGGRSPPAWLFQNSRWPLRWPK